jgi:hypothetical protein
MAPASGISSSSSSRFSLPLSGLDRSVLAAKFDQTADAGSSYNVQSIQSNAAELVTIAADVTTYGWAYFRMLSTSTVEYVDLGPVDASTNFLPIVRLYSAEVAMMPLHPTRAWYAQSGTSSTNALSGVNLEAWINER